MNLSYRDVDFASASDREVLAGWYNDPSIKHLYSLFKDEESLAHQFTAEYFARISKLPREGRVHRVLMVLHDGVCIGEANFEIDPPKLLTKDANTAWLALMIGDASLRRCGLGTRIMGHLEALAADAGAERVELGVFEYNERALLFFESLGYEEFARRADRAYWDGTMWADIRLLKQL